MNKLSRKKTGSLTMIVGGIATAIALIWALVLLGGGLWWLIRRPTAQLNEQLSVASETFSQVQLWGQQCLGTHSIKG
jgi:uncharacterized membrane protein YfbV (UPF0208 family)